MENTLQNKGYLDQDELWGYIDNPAFKNRVNEILAYLDTQNLTGDIADIGENNPLKEAIQNEFFIPIDSIDYNFNWDFANFVTSRYNVITCFEVLEHLMNPLLFLVNVKSLLKENGIIYLSTPYQRPQILKAIHHYHEIPDDRIKWLFDAAKLEIINVTKITIAGNFWYHFKGIRPILRYFQKTRLYKLKAK